MEEKEEEEEEEKKKKKKKKKKKDTQRSRPDNSLNFLGCSEVKPLKIHPQLLKLIAENRSNMCMLK